MGQYSETLGNKYESALGINILRQAQNIVLIPRAQLYEKLCKKWPMMSPYFFNMIVKYILRRVLGFSDFLQVK